MTEWLIQGWIPAGSVGLLTGEGGAGKSLLAKKIALNCESALYVTWEEGVDGAERALDMSEEGPIWAPDIHAHTIREEREDNYGRSYSHFQYVTGDLARDSRLNWKMVREKAENLGASLLVLDPLAAAFAGNEIDRAMVRQFMSILSGWAYRKSCAILILAHPSKGDSRLSGSTDWWNAARFVMELNRDKDKSGAFTDEATLSLLKANYGKPRSAALYLETTMRLMPEWYSSPAIRRDAMAEMLMHPHAV